MSAEDVINRIADVVRRLDFLCEQLDAVTGEDGHFSFVIHEMKLDADFAGRDSTGPADAVRRQLKSRLRRLEIYRAALAKLTLEESDFLYKP